MRLLIHVGEDTTESTLDSFLEANELDQDEIVGIRATLANGDTYYGGGGAAAEWALEPIREVP